MGNKFLYDEDAPYRVRPSEDDLIHNLHALYDSICEEAVPESLMDLLKRLPE